MFNSPTFNPVFFRTYSRRNEDNKRETFEQMLDRVYVELKRLGLPDHQNELVRRMAKQGKVFPSGRMCWVGGTDWAAKPENYSGLYNCTSTVIDRPEAFGWLMDLAMQGSGTGADLTKISELPPVSCGLDVTVVGNAGDWESFGNTELIWHNGYKCTAVVGDSREGWVDIYQLLIDCAMEDAPLPGTRFEIEVVLKRVRPEGKPLKGFGGVANPSQLGNMFVKVADVLNGAIGRQLTSVECSLLIDEAALAVVAGNIRRSAGMRQARFEDEEWSKAKLNLWVQDEEGNWKVDPKRDALRMANHTRVAWDREQLSFQTILNSIRLQYECGEGAIQFAPNAVRRTGLTGGFGLNPCVTGDTKILTVFDGIKTFEQLVEEGEDILVWCVDKVTNEPKISTMRNPRITGYNSPLLKVTFDSGLQVRCTPEHGFFTTQRNKVMAKDLKPGQSVSAFAIHQHSDGHLHILRSLKVVSVEFDGYGDVYNGTVDKYHTYIIVDPSPVGKSFISGVLSANCGEILGENFHCNLAEVHLNNLDPNNLEEQALAFRAAALACLPLLTHKFVNPIYQESRERDPIIGVSFTGLFDFFVKAFGREWLEWWQEGRPRSSARGKKFLDLERGYLVYWRMVVKSQVEAYCLEHNLKIPTRYTTVQPAGTKSLLTNASPGWHPPKAITYIRRITFKRNDPVALVCASQGYSVIPSQSCKHEDGSLLGEDEIYHERCTEWLVEIPVRVSWADVAEGIDPSQFSALAQLDFYMQVQKWYTTHNTSGTIELREHEIEGVARKVHELIHSVEPYISVTFLSRFDDHASFPRLPFEPISNETYLDIKKYVDELTDEEFRDRIAIWDKESWGEISPAPCDSDVCLIGGNHG